MKKKRKLAGKISATRETLGDKVWGFVTEGRPWRIRWPLGFLRLVLAVLRDMREGQFDLRAASLAYTTLLSFAPLLAIAFAVLKGFGAHNVLEPALNTFLSPLGAEQAADISGRVMGFVSHINVGVLGVAGVAVLFYGVVGLLRKVERAFNDIWRVHDGRGLLQRARDYTGVLLVGPLSIFLSMMMTASLRHARLFQTYLHIDIADSAYEGIFSVVPYFLFALAFAALYMFMPNTRVRPGPALVAGVVTGAVWKLLGKLFGLFVAGSASYAAIYSAFAALVLFVLWVYAGWLTVLVGAAVSYYLQNPSNQPMSRGVKNLSLRFKEMLGLQICADIGEAFYKGGGGLTLGQLSVKTGVPALAVEDVVDDLSRLGVLAVTCEGVPAYIPGRPFDETTVAQMMDILRAADETGVLRMERVKPGKAVKTVLQMSDAALHKELGRYSLKQLALGEIKER
ncbi:MAG: YihY family inner membrane protein [Alphaproteobacteria bacterium]|nr:YihY family inner membrane protein [Alphaproteobacteria bacterium]